MNNTVEPQSESREQNEAEISKDQTFSKWGIILWLLASILATYLSYQLGLQQGKQAHESESPRQWLYYFDEEPEPEEAVTKEKKPAIKQETPAPKPIVPKTEPLPVGSRGYTIQLITYRNEEPAKREVESLRKKKHEAFVVRSGDYYQVCIDLFESKELALQKLIQLRKEKYYETYPGAFVKFVKR